MKTTPRYSGRNRSTLYIGLNVTSSEITKSTSIKKGDPFGPPQDQRKPLRVHINPVANKNSAEHKQSKSCQF